VIARLHECRAAAWLLAALLALLLVLPCFASGYLLAVAS
jgi:hypothetical protein